MESWWVRHPGVLEAEKAALQDWGQPWEIDDAQYAMGRLVVRVEVPFGADLHEVTAFYPDSYPYFPPRVRLEAVRLRRHHNPHGDLCLLADDAAEWKPGCDTLAGILRSQVPKLLAAGDPGTDADFVAETEEHAGEPLSNFLEYLADSAILVPDEGPPPTVPAGRLELHGRKHPQFGVVAVLSRVLTDAGAELVNFPLSLAHSTDRFTGNWVRLPGKPELTGNSPEGWREQFFKLAVETSPEFKKRLEAARTGEIFIFGFVYPDEVRWRQNAQDWVFMCVSIEKARKGARPSRTRYALVRADPAGDVVLAMRAPELTALRSKSVLLIGLGAIGSPVALQLARSGIGRLVLLDCDHVQVGNTIRWALGWSAAGQGKAESISAYLAEQYPRTKVEPCRLRIGLQSHLPDGTPLSDYDFLRERIAQADLVIDATASFLVNHLVTDITRREHRPYLWLSTTPGAAGGVVGRVVPGKTEGCWHCFQRHLADGTFPLPRDGGAAFVQPGGCTHPTFVAAGVDSDEVATLASRLAVATLTSGSAHAKEFNWDVAVGDLITDDQRIAGRWTERQLPRHAACPHCAASA